jgi:hypothetical protein
VTGFGPGVKSAKAGVAKGTAAAVRMCLIEMRILNCFLLGLLWGFFELKIVNSLDKRLPLEVFLMQPNQSNGKERSCHDNFI